MAGPGDSPYDAFEEIFRGPESRVRELLEPYVPLLSEHEPVLDVGCGRGELLELLRDAGTAARGVDVDEGMVERTRRKGLDVELADAVSYLERQEPESLGAIFASHVIEHLPYDELLQLFALSRRALRPGGLFVVETINVHSLAAFKTFWTDPSHRAPIFPEVARALALIHGFADAEIIYPRATGDSDVDLNEATEYALVAGA
jgi:SAM-dependent methyltransferase